MAATDLHIVDALAGTTQLPDRDLKAWDGSAWAGGYGSELYRWTGSAWQKMWQWYTPNPGAGSTVTVVQELLSGGDVLASWSNSNSDYWAEVQWRINSSTWGSTYTDKGGTQSRLPEAELSDTDVVEARMRYFEDTYFGSWSDWSDPIMYAA